MIALRKLARELGVVIPISFFEKDGPRYYNSVAIANESGEILTGDSAVAMYRPKERSIVIAAMPSVAARNAGLRNNPKTLVRSGVSLVPVRESNCPRSGSFKNETASASRNPGAAAM